MIIHIKEHTIMKALAIMGSFFYTALSTTSEKSKRKEIIKDEGTNGPYYVWYVDAKAKVTEKIEEALILLTGGEKKEKKGFVEIKELRDKYMTFLEEAIRLLNRSQIDKSAVIKNIGNMNSIHNKMHHECHKLISKLEKGEVY